MSSILDALRKVEAEKAKKKVDLGEVEELLAERDLVVPGEEEQQGRAPAMRLLIVVGTLVVLAAASGVAAFFIYGFVRSGPPEQVTEPQALFPAPTELPQMPAQVTEQAAEPKTPSEVVASVQAPAAGPSVTAPAVQTLEPPAPQPPEAAEPVTAPATPAAVAERASVAAPAQPPQQRPTLKINILRPASDQFPTALAVVNGKKVGIGDYIDGAQVIKIQSDGIVFEYADELFLVKF